MRQDPLRRSTRAARRIAFCAAAIVAACTVLAASVAVGGAPDVHGVADVEHGRVASTPALADCAGLRRVDRRDCYAAAIRGSAGAASNARALLDPLNAHAREERWFAQHCHMLLHPAGRSFGGDITPGEVVHAGKDCSAGFLHGYVEEQLAGRGALDRATVAAVCVPGGAPLAHTDCEHGIGHVLQRNFDGALPRVLLRCTQLGDAAFAVNCASGAFMENRLGGTGRDDASTAGWWSDADPWQPCRASVPRALLPTCAAWSVRQVDDGEQVAFCATVAARGIDDAPCRIAIGLGASVDASGTSTCGTDRWCWYGRGYLWGVHDIAAEAIEGAGGDAPLPGTASSERCATGRPALAAACAEGAGFRRAAGSLLPMRAATRDACAGFARPLAPACARGAARRDAPVPFD